MHDGATGEVDGVQAARAEEAATPHPVRERAVDQERPEADEDEVAAEAHPIENAPAMSAGVMTANVIWKAMNSSGGIVGANAMGVSPTPRSMKYCRPPMTPPWSGPNASE